MDAMLATLFTVASDITLAIEYYRNYFKLKNLKETPNDD